MQPTDQRTVADPGTHIQCTVCHHWVPLSELKHIDPATITPEMKARARCSDCRFDAAEIAYEREQDEMLAPPYFVASTPKTRKPTVVKLPAEPSRVTMTADEAYAIQQAAQRADLADATIIFRRQDTAEEIADAADQLLDEYHLGFNVSSTPRATVHNRKTEEMSGPRDTYIGRGSPFGNPFSHIPGSKARFLVSTRAEAIAKYRAWIHQPAQASLRERAKNELFGQRLFCYCAPLPCHGDVLAEIVNQPDEPKKAPTPAKPEPAKEPPRKPRHVIAIAGSRRFTDRLKDVEPDEYKDEQNAGYAFTEQLVRRLFKSGVSTMLVGDAYGVDMAARRAFQGQTRVYCHGGPQGVGYGYGRVIEDEKTASRSESFAWWAGGAADRHINDRLRFRSECMVKALAALRDKHEDIRPAVIAILATKHSPGTIGTIRTAVANNLTTFVILRGRATLNELADLGGSWKELQLCDVKAYQYNHAAALDTEFEQEALIQPWWDDWAQCYREQFDPEKAGARPATLSSATRLNLELRYAGKSCDEVFCDPCNHRVDLAPPGPRVPMTAYGQQLELIQEPLIQPEQRPLINWPRPEPAARQLSFAV